MKAISDLTEKLKVYDIDIEEENVKPKMLINGVLREIDWFDGKTLETSMRVSYTLNNASYSYETDYGLMQKNMKRIENSGLKHLVDKCRFDNFKTEYKFQETMKKAALHYLKMQEGWFVILGHSGGGKTHICTALSKEFMEKGKSFEYLVWVERMNEIKFDLPKYEALLKRYAEVDVLYIDDFFKTQTKTNKDEQAKISEIEIKLAFQILDARYRNNKLTIISSEKSIEEIREYDYAIAGRIVEKAEKYLLKLGNNSNKDMRIGVE